MSKKVLGFLGLGSIGFPMCYGLVKSGWTVILPTYRRNEDCGAGFSPLAPDTTAKNSRVDEMLSMGALAARDQAELARQCDIILISMPTSRQVETLILGEGGILTNAKPGTIVIDLTTADPSSTKKLSRVLEERGIEMLDAPVSGGIPGAIAQTLSIMVGGKEDVFEQCRPILETIGKQEKILYIGPSAAGNTMKLVNNFLSACTTVATTEALMVAVKSGIDPRRAIEVLKDGSGRSDASMNKYPNLIFPGREFNFALSLMCKDVGLFNQAAKDHQVPAFLSNMVYQLWDIPMAELGGDQDCLNVIKMYERWCGVKVCGIDADAGRDTMD